MIADELEALWAAERAVPNRRRYEGRRLPSSALDVYAGVEPGSDRRFVAWRLGRELQRAIRHCRPRSSRGIVTEAFDEGEVQSIILTEQPGIPTSVFPAVMVDVLTVVLNGAASTSVRHAFERFSSWQRALQRRTGPMGAQEVRGVMGELLTLRDLIVPALGLVRGLERWAAIGENDLNDFDGPGWLIEVKTILAFRTSIRISALGQLEPAAGGRAWLSLVELEQADDGESLSDLVESVRALAGGDDRLRQEVDHALIRRGAVDPALDAETNVRYRVAMKRAFHVGPDFPILRRALVPTAITRAEYDIELAACLPFEVEAATIPNELRALEGAL